jgi:glycosyltransferase involved in cell wall biosynthesis
VRKGYLCGGFVQNQESQESWYSQVEAEGRDVERDESAKKQMISIIIPLMPIDPYDRVIKECASSLQHQGADKEIIIVEQVVERYIYKNKLLNSGYRRSKGETVFFCDADMTMEDPTLLERMQAKLDEGYDVVFPKFYSEVYEDLKIADGAPCFKREVMLKHGPLKEELKGISWVTFPFLNWCLNNTKYYCGNDIVLTHKRVGGKGKRNGATGSMMRPIFKQTVKRLKAEGLWPA